MSSKLFPDPRRIVTGHNAEGKAVVVADSTIPCVPTAVKCNFAVLYETHQFPDSLDEWVDPTKNTTKDLSNSNGVVLRVVDIAPKTETMFHRTESLDFGILHSGEITCYLDDGVRIDMKPGDVCVQRGTIHGWTNHSDKPARIYFILTAAHPVKVEGKLLTTTGYSKEHVASGGEAR
ncbi:Cupin, RmlC-type [Niveomyces insectorum RCEF 264]|uniref:Cupin, RmlC-type n=1 Tax=Niveomyces insectorum RCEF 264 TaxID=1081102 RepID=A0A167ZX29_9HYPO|nr:Cupin, RmlC-type [Niveomyces insectorum RCEF 264]